MEQIGNFTNRKNRKITKRLVEGGIAVVVLGSMYLGLSLSHISRTKNQLEKLETERGRLATMSVAQKTLDSSLIYRTIFWGEIIGTENYLEQVSQDEEATHSLFPYTKTKLDDIN